MQEMQSWIYRVGEWFLTVVLANDSGHRLYWFYLMTSVAIASVIYLIRKPPATNLFSFIFPGNMFSNRSSVTDLKIYLINSVLGAFINLATFFASIAIVAEAVTRLLVVVFGARTDYSEANALIVSAFGIAFLLLTDFAVFFAHYLHHKIPALWSFHKTHHSAEVLTPVTAFRFHPVELVFNGFMLALFVGPLVGTFQYLFAPEIFSGSPRIFGMAMLLWLLTANFRHSHIPLHYPRLLSRWVVSPVMHNIHHSTQRRHFDKNFGLLFSFWDRIAGTWYLPDSDEKLSFGLGHDETFQSVAGCYWSPFKESSTRIKQLAARLSGRHKVTGSDFVESARPSPPCDDQSKPGQLR